MILRHKMIRCLHQVLNMKHNSLLRFHFDFVIIILYYVVIFVTNTLTLIHFLTYLMNRTLLHCNIATPTCTGFESFIVFFLIFTILQATSSFSSYTSLKSLKNGLLKYFSNLSPSVTSFVTECFSTFSACLP